MAWWAVAAAVGSQLISANMNRQASKKATKAQNEATDRSDAYNLEAWSMQKDQLRANHAYQLSTREIQRQNNRTNADFQDANNLQKWNYDLMIRNSEQSGMNAQYQKSEELYRDQLSLNHQAAGLAVDNERTRLAELRTEKAFEDQDLVIDAMLKSDALKARGMQGRSVEKAIQSVIMSRGRNSAILHESLTSGTRDVYAALQEIANDKTGADLAAFAQKMLEPGALPIRPLPLKTPVPVLPDPRPLAEWDFGPEPVGGYQKADTSWLEFGASAAQAVGTGISTYKNWGE